MPNLSNKQLHAPRQRQGVSAYLRALLTFLACLTALAVPAVVAGQSRGIVPLVLGSWQTISLGGSGSGDDQLDISFFSVNLQAGQTLRLTSLVPERTLVHGIGEPQPRSFEPFTRNFAPVLVDQTNYQSGRYSIFEYEAKATGTHTVALGAVAGCNPGAIQVRSEIVDADTGTFVDSAGGLRPLPLQGNQLYTAIQDSAVEFGSDLMVSLPFTADWRVTPCSVPPLGDALPNFFWTVHFQVEAGQIVEGRFAGLPEEAVVYATRLGSDTEIIAGRTPDNSLMFRFPSPEGGLYLASVRLPMATVRAGNVPFSIALRSFSADSTRSGQ